jgi:hypothetical protein
MDWACRTSKIQNQICLTSKRLNDIVAKYLESGILSEGQYIRLSTGMKIIDRHNLPACIEELRAQVGTYKSTATRYKNSVSS